MAISFYEEGVTSHLKNKRPLKAFIQTIIATHLPEIKKTEINYIFCDNEYLLEKNIQFLNHDTYTDIITFDLSENEHHLIAEIFVSCEQVKDNAEQFKVSYLQELHRVIFHGVLHLCGFGDHTKKEQAEMRAAEEQSLTQYFN